VSVDEIIEEIKHLGPAERAKVQQALDAASEEQPAMALQQRLEEARRMLDAGWCQSGGRALSQGIDEAVYGGEA